MTFALNFFEALGIEAVMSDGGADRGDTDGEGGPRIAILCSSDKIYDVHAETEAKQLKAGGIKHLFLAGRPGENNVRYRAAGIDTFISRGTNIVEVGGMVYDFMGEAT